jgi:hypothetical protein
MKKFVVLLTVCLIFSIAGYSQVIAPEKVPVPVKKAFSKKFPAAVDVKYEMEKKDYEITFKDEGTEMSAIFDATGAWIETETEIKASDLPAEVSASVKKNFPGFKLSEIVRTETPTMGFSYEMDMKKAKEGYEVQFSLKGEILKKTPLEEENGEEEKPK